MNWCKMELKEEQLFEHKTESELNSHFIIAHFNYTDSNLIGFSSYDIYEAQYRKFSLQKTFDKVKERLYEILSNQVDPIISRIIKLFSKSYFITKNDFLNDKMYRLDVFAYLEKMLELQVAKGSIDDLLKRYSIEKQEVLDYMKSDLNFMTREQKNHILFIRQKKLREENTYPSIKELSQNYNPEINLFYRDLEKFRKQYQ